MIYGEIDLRLIIRHNIWLWNWGVRCERTSFGSLRRRSWYRGHTANMCRLSSIVGSKKGRCLMSSKSGSHSPGSIQGADARGSCPASHKYAYYNGDYCCHYNREKNSGEVNHDYIPLCYFTHYLLLLLTLHVTLQVDKIPVFIRTQMAVE